MGDLTIVVKLNCHASNYLLRSYVYTHRQRLLSALIRDATLCRTAVNSLTTAQSDESK